MKKIALFLLGAAMLYSCSKDNGYDNYHRKLGIYEIEDAESGSYQIILDNGDVLLSEESSGNYSSYVDGDRIVVNYSKISSTSLEDGTEIINSAIHYIEKVLTKDVITLSNEIADSIGNNTIHVHEEDFWFSNNFLNVYFSYYGYNQVHYINLIKYENDSVDSDGRLILELRHNKNNDLPQYAYDGFASFDMNSLYQPGMDSIPIVVKVNDYYVGTVSWNSTYYFNTQHKSTKVVDTENLNILIK